MSTLLDKLHDAVLTITELVVQKEHKHMKKPWEMILGGLIIPALVSEDEDILKEASNAELMKKYSKEKIKEFFNPTPKVIETEKIVEVPKEIVKEVIIFVFAFNV